LARAKKEAIAEVLGNVSMYMVRTSYVVKLMMINLQSWAFWARDGPFIKKITSFMDPERLALPNAKVPYLTGICYKNVDPASSEPYMALWPVHPVPHFIMWEDFYNLVCLTGGVPDNIPCLSLKNPQGKKATNTMRELLKHILGWLVQSGVKLTEPEFKIQVM